MVHLKERWTECCYMSGPFVVPEKYMEFLGFNVSIQTSPRPHLIATRPWFMDNDAFTGKFEVRAWIARLRECKKYLDTCLFVVVPDVVGDYQMTLEQFPRYAKIVRKFGYPVAFVTQNGLTPDKTPWDDFDALFIGGTDEHKLGAEAGVLIDEAIRHGKWVHIGRVNSPSRMRQFWRADSWDGTTINREPAQAKRLVQAVREIRAMKAQPKLWEDL